MNSSGSRSRAFRSLHEAVILFPRLHFRRMFEASAVSSSTFDTLIIAAIGVAGGAGLVFIQVLIQWSLRKQRPAPAQLPRDLVEPMQPRAEAPRKAAAPAKEVVAPPPRVEAPPPSLAEVPPEVVAQPPPAPSPVVTPP